MAPAPVNLAIAALATSIATRGAAAAPHELMRLLGAATSYGTSGRDTELAELEAAAKAFARARRSA